MRLTCIFVKNEDFFATFKKYLKKQLLQYLKKKQKHDMQKKWLIFLAEMMKTRQVIGHICDKKIDGP